MRTRYQISEFAQLGGVSAKTLRFYDAIGVFRPASVDPRTGYRRYLPQQLEELASILVLKNLGVSLAQVRELTSKGGTAQSRRELLMELKQRLEGSIRTTEQSLNWIAAALNESTDSRAPVPVVVKRRPRIPIASIRSRVRHYADMDRFEQDLQRSLPSQAIGDLRGVLWHHCADSGYLEGEVFIALKQRVPARSAYDLKQLPAATLACAYSAPDGESAEQSYIALRKWMALRGYAVAGPKREIYLYQMLEIQFPLMSD